MGNPLQDAMKYGIDDYINTQDFFKKNDFWDIVGKIGWKEACDKYLKSNRDSLSPTKVLKLKVNEVVGTDKTVRERLHDMARQYRSVLQDWLESYSFRKYGDHHAWPNNSDGKLTVSDDGWWDLCAHIVGCGRDAYYKAFTDPESIVEDYKDNHYVENFEYILGPEDDK